MNTIDLYGDVTALRMILDDTLDIFEDDIIEAFDSNVFAYHTSLTTISLPNATSFSARMLNCVNLQTLNLPKVETIYGYISNASLQSLSFPELKTISYAGSGLFANNGNLTSVSLPKLTSAIESSTFQNCSSLSYISAPSATSVGSYAFSSCSSLSSVSFPLANDISNDAFNGCYALQSVDLPKVHYISQKSFCNCSSLTALSFPEAYSISKEAFSSCTLLSSLTLGYESSVCTLSSTSAFTDTQIASGTGHIYVPTSLYSQYITATNWSTFASSITTITS